MKSKLPLVRTPYPQDRRARKIGRDLPDGPYVYVQDVNGDIYVLPDGPHLHPKVLGQGRPALYAGDMTLQQGRVKDLTNLSGTFQFDDPQGLLAVARKLEEEGFVVNATAVRYFPKDGSRPEILPPTLAI
ncbi:MAG: hypothetical protein IT428_19195 [Planctomycetaceae bacterium]|nr:hypothetical protein [Planctomycetaceae bacterium]